MRDKFLGSTLFLSALAITSSLFAISEDSEQEIGAAPMASCQVAPEPIRNTPCCLRPCRDVTPSARGCEGINGIFATASFLWWTAHEDDFTIAFAQTADFPSQAFPFTTFLPGNQGKIIRMNFNWDPGFRVGLGWNTPYDGWDVYLNWTWYQNHKGENHEVETTPNQTGIISTWLFIVPFNVAQAKCNYRMLLNMGDLEIGRDFYLSESLTLRPFFGPEGGWIERDLRISISDQNPALSATLRNVTPGTYHARTNYWGLGPRMGINGNMRFCRGFKFFGNLSTALLYGKVFKNQQTSSQLLQNATLLTSNVTDTNNFWKVVPHLQMNLGLGWGDCICVCGNRMFVGLNLGWEVNYYMNLPHFVYPSGFSEEIAPNSENISTAGLTLDFKVDF
ncbi:MAG: Lpg1974 family pore-forming outer membrane protein [Chlamydiota bacterium]